MRDAIGLLLLASPALAADPAPPPTRRVVVAPGPAPVIVAPPVPPAPAPRGPVRVRLGTAMGQMFAEQGAKLMTQDVPRAIADSVRRGDYQLRYQFSVTPGAPAAPPR